MTDNEALRSTEEISNLLGLYCHYADDENYDAWASLFVDDGAMTIQGHAIAGASALKAWLISVKSGTPLRHLMFNPVITIDSSTTAHGTIDAIYLGDHDGRWGITASPRYDDQFVRVDGSWRFLSRNLQLRMPVASP